MKRIALAAVLVLTVIVPGALWAKPKTQSSNAAKFARDCNDDGAVFVTGTLHVGNGHGKLKQTCFISMAPNATLAFDRTKLDGEGLLIGDSQNGSQVLVNGVDFHLTLVQLSPGCCAGQGEPGRDESNTSIFVQNSTIERDQGVE